MIRAAIFDLDGVIVDTAKYHYLAWRRLAAELGFDFSEADNERLKGVSRMRSLDILLEVGGMEGRFPAAEKESLAAKKNGWYVKYISKMTPDEILPGVIPFLAEVREDGVRTALGSASRNTGIILSRLGIGELFDTVVDGTMVTRTKPDPEVFLKCAALLGDDIHPGECVVFEDAAAGIEAAVAAGMYSVGIGSPGVLKRADVVIPGFEGVTWRRIEDQLSMIRHE